MKERRPHKVCFIECSPKLRLWRLCGRCSAALRRKRSSVWTHVRGAYVAAPIACTSQNGLFRSLTFTVYRLTFVTVCSRLLTIVTTATMLTTLTIVRTHLFWGIIIAMSHVTSGRPCHMLPRNARGPSPRADRPGVAAIAKPLAALVRLGATTPVACTRGSSSPRAWSTTGTGTLLAA